ncbi:D-alanyl-D-alanine carboxypeptidase family protein [Ectobacillus antri]|uniref:D-alanyl-D-alanine carboxypeptidase family protein n=1 Tax=Ectobacillus antri TaxID=2486280 RepID=UPI000F5A9CFC|nr:D-alanyl-D-alanine carboxypeptidase family protein [Ectobacillus antri]
MRIALKFTLIFYIVLCLPVHTYAAFGDVSARNAVLIEQTSGRVLYEKMAHQSEKIASITKIMTALLATESGKMKEKVTISSNAVRVEGSSIYLKPGDKVVLEDLVYGLMLRSGNDAAHAIAEYVGGSVEGFVYMMNEKANEIGMKHTHFSNPSGLDGDGTHYSSAYDMAMLTRYAMNNTAFKKIFGTKSYQSESWDYPWKNKHKLLTFMYESTTGGKTGFTKKAGRTLVTTASKNGLDLIVVTLQASSDWDDHMYLFEQGFKQYKLTDILVKGGLRVEDGAYQNHLYIKNPLSYPLAKGEDRLVQVDVELVKQAKPKDGEVVGKAILRFDGKVVGQRNVFYSKKKQLQTTGVLWSDFKEVFSSMLGVKYDG